MAGEQAGQLVLAVPAHLNTRDQSRGGSRGAHQPHTTLLREMKGFRLKTFSRSKT